MAALPPGAQLYSRGGAAGGRGQPLQPPAGGGPQGFFERVGSWFSQLQVEREQAAAAAERAAAAAAAKELEDAVAFAEEEEQAAMRRRAAAIAIQRKWSTSVPPLRHRSSRDRYDLSV